MRAAGKPVLVNFFASWCIPCVQEAPVLMGLKQQGVPIWGIAYKDTAEAAAGFLVRHGDPYARLARDEPGRVAIDFGLYGVPETYLIDRAGIVRWRWAGGLSDDVVIAATGAAAAQLRLIVILAGGRRFGSAPPPPTRSAARPRCCPTRRRRVAPKQSVISSAAWCARTRASKNPKPIWPVTSASVIRTQRGDRRQ